jgi:hypothetical protein
MLRSRLVNGGIVAALALVAALPTGALARPRLNAKKAPIVYPHSAGLQQCIGASIESARSVTFVAQMHAVRGARRMALQIDLQESLPEEAFTDVKGPGVGQWHVADAGVAVLRAERTLSVLAAPATYRAVVYFHWMNEAGRVVHRAVSYTRGCRQRPIRVKQSSAASVAARTSLPVVRPHGRAADAR